LRASLLATDGIADMTVPKERFTNISLNPMAFDVPASATALGANEMEVMRGLTVPVLTDRTRKWTSTGSRSR
jgi:hypothetical protein